MIIAIAVSQMRLRYNVDGRQWLQNELHITWPSTCQVHGLVLVRYLSGLDRHLPGTDSYLSCTWQVLGQVLDRYLTGTCQALVRHFLGTCHVLDQARWMLCNCQADWSARKLSRSWQNSKLTDRWLVPSKGWTSSCSHWGTPMTTLPLTAA